MLRKSLMFSMLTAIIAFHIVPFTFPVYASGTILRLSPSTLEDESLTPCNNITLTVEILNVINMYAYELKVFYKNSVLNATKAVRPAGHFMEPSDPINQFIPKWEIKNDYNATHGRIWLSFTLLAPEPAKTGSGALVQITFHIVGVGQTPITLKDTKVADNSGSPIPHTAESASFSNEAPPPPPPPAEMYIDPEELIDPALTPCQNFTINVTIQNAIDLYSFDFKLTYNPTMIEATEIEEGTFFKNVGPTTILTIEINNTEGYLRFAVTLLSPPGAYGNGTLAKVNFHVLDMGATIIKLQETSLVDSSGSPLAHTTKDGYFANVIFATLFVDPPEIINPTLIPGSIFSIDIKIKNVKDMYSYKFQLNYESIVLTCIGVYVHPALNETNFSSSFSVNDGTGEITVNVTYYPPANPISTIDPISLVTLTFKVDTMGTSNLTLNETEILDPNGEPIPHETEDGFFQSVIRDVAVIYVAPQSTVVYEGYSVNITVVVLNKGDLPETFNVTAYYNENPIDTYTVVDLPPGENVTIIFQWDTDGLPPCQNYTIKAEAETVPYETQTYDNIYVDGAVKIKITGDINGDSIVDIFDLSIVAIAFASQPGDSNWNPDADLDKNNLVDIFDLVRITINFGRTC